MATDAGQSEILKKITQTATNAKQELLGLSRLSALFDQRLNLVVSFLANSFLLYDIQVMFALENWKRKNKNPFSFLDTCSS